MLFSIVKIPLQLQNLLLVLVFELCDLALVQDPLQREVFLDSIHPNLKVLEQ